MIKKIKEKKAFTLIELIVTMAVLGILVLLASPRFFGHTQNAELTKGFANARSIEKASELYYMDNEDWPRLTDEPYTSEEIESYSERIFNHTGHEVNLDPEGNYYDIDYDKLSDYIRVPDDKKNYILQNPVGKIYYMENLNEAGIARVDYSNAKEKDDNPGGLREPIEGEIAIDSADKLAKIGQTEYLSDYPLDGDYILTANINLSNTENWTPIGNNNSRFTGSFDGNGYNITGLTINRSTENYIGLFGYTQGAIIENVALEDINITGNSSVGGIVGQAASGSTISNSYAKGNVTGSGNNIGGLLGYATSTGGTTISTSYATGSVTGANNVGGLVGYAISSTTISTSYTTGAVKGNNYVGGLVGEAGKHSTISNSYATGSVEGIEKAGGLVGRAENAKISNSYTTGSVKGGNEVGGLVGAALNSTIENSYTTGSVTDSGNYVGGLVGYAYRSTIENSYSTGSVRSSGGWVGGLVGFAYESTIENSYATGSVKGSGSFVGGLVGMVGSSPVMSSYWDKETTHQTKSAGGTGKTTSDMKKKATYSRWDFNTVWEIDEGKDYPKLR